MNSIQQLKRNLLLHAPQIKASLLSWPVIFLIFAILNLKALPLAWHFRLAFRFFTHLKGRDNAQKVLKRHREAPPANAETKRGSKADGNDLIHPIFRPVSITLSVPLLETDYNLHKSNSTYFSDLDESRTALVTGLYGPALFFRMPPDHPYAEIVKNEPKGVAKVILGSVHTSFHREVKPFSTYEVRSRVLGWDRKWLVIGSWFVRPGKGGKEGNREVLLASSLSKYVVKKGRLTVSPERCLRVAGWLPDPASTTEPISEPGTEEKVMAVESERVSESTVLVSKDISEKSLDASPSETDTPTDEGGLTSMSVPDASSILPPVLQTDGQAHSGFQSESQSQSQSSTPPTEQSSFEAITKSSKGPEEETLTIKLPLSAPGANWSYEDIEAERRRGLKIVEEWLALDGDLVGEFARLE